MFVWLMRSEIFLPLVLPAVLLVLVWPPRQAWGAQPAEDEALGGDFGSPGVSEVVYQEGTDVMFSIQSATFAGGDGTPGNPYQIATAEQLNNVRNNLSAHYKLIADIDLGVAPYNQGGGWEPIGTEVSFTGTFDGNGYKITNLTIDRQEQILIGLFGGIGSGAVIKNVKLEEVNVKGNNFIVGGLVGDNYQGTITGCYVTGAVSGNQYIGGLVGRNHSGTITGSYADVGVQGIYSVVGGLVGHNCRNHAKIENSYATGAVFGEYNVGGLVGVNDSGTITGCYYDKQTTNQSDTGKGEPKTTAEMKQINTFAGWDFKNVWYIWENNTYPRLRWEQ